MPYIIAIVLVAVAALVFFSRPAPVESPAEATTESAPASVDATIVEEQNAPEAPAVEVEPETDATTQPAAAAEPASDTTQAATPTAVALSADATYLTPARKEHGIGVALSIEDGVITAANVQYDNAEAKTPQHKAFDAVYQSEVVGKNINALSLSRVGGASLTTAAFNEAVAEIKTQL